MISKKMYRILKNVPHAPQKINLKELREKINIDITEMWEILEDAISCNYIAFTSHDPHNTIPKSDFCLTKAGQIEIEEYGRTISSESKATWALVIAGLSFVVSIIAIFC